jgi:AraC-like DNA-binding protein
MNKFATDYFISTYKPILRPKNDKYHIQIMKNINISNVKVIRLDQYIELALCENQSDTDGRLTASLFPGMVHFIFSISGSGKLEFIPSQYALPLVEGEYYALYNPVSEAPFELVLNKGSKTLLIQIEAKMLHSYFLPNSSELSFLHGENAKKKFYKKEIIEPSLFVPLNQLFIADSAENTLLLYQKAKVLEVMSICFGKRENPDEEACPFLRDEDNVDKIRAAKRILIAKLANPPSLKDLSKEIGLNEYNLKTGFKNIYGVPVMTWLSNYKMELARKHLMDNSTKINEIADQLGYNSASHFIESFKKKFGITPKKFQQSISS